MKANRFSKLVPIALLALVVCLSVGCVGTHGGVETPPALIYKRTVTPLSLGEVASPAGPPPEQKTVVIPDDLKMGEAQTYQLNFALPMTAFSAVISMGWGDFSMEAAMRDRSIKKVSYADIEYLDVLLIFRRATIRAYGTQKAQQATATLGPELDDAEETL